MRRKIFVSITILIIGGLGYLLGWSNYLTVNSVKVVGAPTQSLETQVKELAKIELGMKLARIEPRVVSAEIERFDWVKKASVNRNWISHQVTILLEPRVAIASVGNRFLDGEGFIFDAPVSPSATLPQIIAADLSSRAEAIKLFRALPDTFAKNVSSLTATGNQFLFTVDGPTFDRQIDESNNAQKYGITWGKNENNELKIKVFNQLIALPENQKITYLDLSDPKSPIVR